MWTCRYCGEQHEDQFEVCWSCGIPAGGNAPPEDPGEQPPAGEDPASAETGSVERPAVGMTDLDLAMLACRTVALVLFAQAAYFLLTGGLLLVAALIAEPFGGTIDRYGLLALVLANLPSVALAAVGVYYWNHTDRIARSMVGDGPEKTASIDVRLSELMTVAFSLAGVFLFVEAVREAVGIVFLVNEHSRWFAESTPAELLRLPQFWIAVVQLAASLWLMLGSRGIVRGIRWLRHAGTRPPADAEATDRG